MQNLSEIHRLGFEFRNTDGMKDFFEAVQTLGSTFTKCVIVHKDALHDVPQKTGGPKIHEYLVKSKEAGNE